MNHLMHCCHWLHGGPAAPAFSSIDCVCLNAAIVKFAWPDNMDNLITLQQSIQCIEFHHLLLVDQ
jgi:hypothetical protein